MSRHTADPNRTCTIYDSESPTERCQGEVWCRGRCRKHYLSLRRFELEGRATELEKLEPQRPKWSWPGDEQFLIDRLERAEFPEDEEKDQNGSHAGSDSKGGEGI